MSAVIAPEVCARIACLVACVMCEGGVCNRRGEAYMPWMPRGVTKYAGHVRTFSREMRLYILATFVSFLNIGFFQVLYNLYLDRLGLREDYIGTFNAVQTVALAAAALTIGPVVNRFGARRVALWGFVFLSIVGAAQATNTNPTVLLACAALQGIGTSYFINPTNLLILDYTEGDNRQYATSIVYAVQAAAGTFGNLGGGVLPRAVAALVPSFAVGSVETYRVTLLIGVAVAALALIPLARIDPDAGQRRGEMAGVRAQEAPAPTEVRRQTRWDFGVFLFTGGLLAVATASVVPFYNVYLIRLGAGTETVGYIYAGASLFAACVSLFGPVLAERLGQLRASAVLRLLPFPLFAAMTFAPSLALAIPAHAVRVTSVNASWPIDATFIAELLPPRLRAYIFSMRSVTWNAVWAGTSIVAGVVIRATNAYTINFAVYVVFLVLNVLIFQVYFGRRVAARTRATMKIAPSS